MKTKKRIFDIENLAAESNVDAITIEKIAREAREEFPNDEMMVELHVLRALRQIHRERKN